MDSRKRNVKRNAAWAVANRLIQTLFPFAVRTVLIYTMGDQYVGLGGLFTSVLKILSLAELGFSSAITYNMYKPIADGNIQEICALLNLYKKIYRAVGTFILGIGLFLMPFISHLTNGEYPNDINIYILYAIYLTNTLLSYFLFAYRTSLLNAYQRYDIVSIVSGLVSMVLYSMEIIVILISRNFYFFAACSIVCTIFNNLSIYALSTKLFPEIKCRGQVKNEIIDDVKKRVKALLGHRIGTAVITSADNIVISKFLGLVSVTFFNNYYFVIAAMIGFVDVIQGSATASIGNSLVKERKEKNLELFMTMNFTSLWIVGWATICYVVLIQDFIVIWLGEKYLYESLFTLLLFGLYFYTWKIRGVVLRFKEAAGMWNADFWKPYISASVNLLLNILLSQVIGINGVLISTIIAMVFINLPWEVHVLFNDMFEKNSISYYTMLLKMILFTVICGIISYGVCRLVGDVSIVNFIIKLILCIIVPNVLFLIMFRNDVYFKKAESLIIKK